MYVEKHKGPKRGIALYSYSAEFGFEKNLEECFEDMLDMGAHGLEILANTHIENYPYPTDAWVDKWFGLCEKYEIIPIEYGHWIDCRVLQGRELTTEEAVARLEQDMRLAHRLGFHILRTKMSVKNGNLDPVDNWREIIRAVLPLAERLDLKLCPEIHTPTSLSSQMIQDYVDFIEETGTKHFGLNIDFSVFRTSFGPGEYVSPSFKASKPEEIIPLLPYIYCCHAKLFHMSDDFEETMVPYKEILQILKDHEWDGYLLSEYEGKDKYDPGYEVGHTLRKQHIMMKNILGY